MTSAPPPPLPRLCLGVTGHRHSNAGFAARQTDVEQALDTLFARIDALVGQETESLGPVAAIRLHCLLAPGADQIAAACAITRAWELLAPLPFGRELNLAINAAPQSLADAVKLLEGFSADDAAVTARANAIRQWYDTATLFELADRDQELRRLFLETLAEPADRPGAQSFAAHCSARVALAGRVMIEQSDIIVAVWDGATRSLVGGTGHTIAAALELSTPVICIDPARPDGWSIFTSPEALTASRDIAESCDDLLDRLVRTALRPGEGGALRRRGEALGHEEWRPQSSRIWTGYRRIEVLFGGDARRFRSLVQTYEAPEEIGEGSGQNILAAAGALTQADPAFAGKIETEVLRRFAWADGISSRLSDHYRSGMIANFLLATFAIAAGIFYQPIGREEQKWVFALIEFLLLCLILLITLSGARLRWHQRWFETRRIAEYFRHAPILLLLGVARPSGRWPRGRDTNWPEYYARHGLRAIGLPHVAITQPYLRQVLEQLLDDHVVRQRDYHIAKAKRLTRVHHGLDRLSERLFQMAVVSVAIFLTIKAGAALGWAPTHWPHDIAKICTFLGVIFPTLGASIAGIRYFGDFERFAAISHITADKLDSIHHRIRRLLEAPASALDYGIVSALAHATDDVVVDEIENWQAVFVGKHISIPV